MTSEPPQNEIDSSTPDPVAEHDERRRQLRVRRASASATRSPSRARPRSSRARSRPGDDDTLIRIWAPSRASSCGHRQVPEVLADGDARRPTPSRDGTARSMSPGGEEPALVEQPVGRQEELAVDVPDLAVLEQRRGDEQPVVGRFLDERDDRRQPARRARRARPAAGRRAASPPRRRGPGADSRSARARGRRRGRRRRRAPRRAARGAGRGSPSSSPSRGAIWASAMRSGCTRREYRRAPCAGPVPRTTASSVARGAAPMRGDAGRVPARLPRTPRAARRGARIDGRRLGLRQGGHGPGAGA